MRALPIFLSDVKARRGKMVEFTRRVMSDKRGTMSAECDSLRLAASDGCSAGNTPELLAVSRKPMALSDALAYELYGPTEDGIRIVGGGA
jgi:hypothetical protein